MMELMRDTYVVSRVTIALVLEALSENWFSYDGDGAEGNNDDIIAADQALRAEVEAQEIS